MRFGAAIPCLNEWAFMPAVLGQLLKVCDRVVVLRGTRSLSGAEAMLSFVPPMHPRVELVEGSWGSEHETRNAGMEILTTGVGACDYVFTVDSDEILSIDALKLLMTGCQQGHRAISGRFITYWKSVNYRIDPPETLIAPLVVRGDVRFEKLRMFSGTQAIVNQYVMHHLSYVRTDEEVKEKLRLFGHASEVVPDWYEKVWKAWDQNHDLENLHPTHPEAYKRAVPVKDGKLEAILKEHGVEV